MTLPDWQIVAVVIVVLGAAGYLVWKVVLGGKAPKRRKPGPDVPLGQLVRRKKREPNQ